MKKRRSSYIIFIVLALVSLFPYDIKAKTVKDFEILAFCKVLGISLEDLYSDTEKYYEA